MFPKSRRPFVPLSPVAMVTREQDPSLLFNLNPKEGVHTSSSEMEQHGLSFSVERVASKYFHFSEIWIDLQKM